MLDRVSSPAPQASVFPPGGLSESKLLALIASVQFVNILDFMMVMPLGPDFAAALGISPSKLGLIGGSYTAAAAVAGLGLSPVLDRFGRRQALTLSLAGLALATALGAFAQGLNSLVACRLLAGFFGGPATSVALSIVADSVPAERRGRALGIVMGAFAVASVLGVPAGLELATLWSWRAPFLAVGALGGVITLLARFVLPPLRGHLQQTVSLPPMTLFALLRRPIVRWSLTCTALAMLSSFALIPNLAAFLQFNRAFPREHLGKLYLAGGVVAFFATRIAGRLADKLGSTRVAIFGTVIYVAITTLGVAHDFIPVTLLFIAFMLANSSRMVPMNALTSRVPASHERARFLSVQSAVQHIASALGAILSTRMLTSEPDGSLVGMEYVAYGSAFAAAVLPFALRVVEQRVRAMEVARKQPAPPAPPQAAEPVEVSAAS